MTFTEKARIALAVFTAAFLAGAVISGTGRAYADNAPLIRSIVVTGNSRIETETVKHHLTLEAGQRYDARKADDSIKALFATGLFSDAHIKFEAGAAVVSVTENPL